ncbi:MAG TPA: serine hydroxymethyltransferase [Gammaproteobacteria bacterium]|nr:serine hydroxymethyltransferase [Gammaproteobacteria bacterium]
MSDMPALRATDPEIYDLIGLETKRQNDFIRLIPSENYASAAVMEATGSILNNKYSEGYPGKRYYEGQDYIDRIETLAIERAKGLFGMQHANVQPYSGSPANQAVYLALAKPGDAVMGLGLPFGGHLTHGWNVNFSGIVYHAAQYDVDPDTHQVDLNRVETLAKQVRPKLMFCGGTAYPRVWDYAGFASIAASVGAVLVADIAHIAGLIVAGAHPHPYPHAKIITTTTHKTLRGPRGGMILCDATYAKDIDRAVFPGLQGGPHNHTTAAIAVALKEAGTEDFRRYGHQIVKNAKALAAALTARGFRLISGGTDNHLILIDVTPRGITGKPAARALHEAGIECNYNTIPFDPRKPFDPSGLRIGTPSITSRGMTEKDMEPIAEWIDRVLRVADDQQKLHAIRAEIAEFCRAFPAPGIRL